MKNILTKLIVLLFILVASSNLGSSQENLTNELKFEVNRIYPYISITKEELTEANSLIDLNERYKPSWIRDYISVEVLTYYKGKIKKAVSKNDILSQEQKDNMNMADAGTDISVKVHYMPENNLKHNDVKELNFTFTVTPENEAKYPGGELQLKKYLKEKAIDKIPSSTFKNYDLAAIKFTIGEEGEIINAHVFETAKDEKIDELLLEAVRNMPCWNPAEYANGFKVKQDFVLTIGNMENCMIHLLNIRRDIN
jgi:hypothetical protein